MSGLDTLPDAPAVAQMVMLATGESPSDLRIAGRGETTIAWRADTSGGALCVLIGIPGGTPPRIEARAAAISALQERDNRVPGVHGTADDPGIPPTLHRWPWLVARWMRGTPLAGPGALTPAVARDAGEVLAALHAAPVPESGPLAGGEGDAWAASWPFDGSPLAAHALVAVAPHLVLHVAAMREQLLSWGDQSARAIVHGGVQPDDLRMEDDRLAGLTGFRHATVQPPATDIARFALAFGWGQTDALLEGYAANRVLRDIRRAEAYQLAVLFALESIDTHARVDGDTGRLAEAIAFLEATLPHAVRRTDA